jgi:hypothetical protein
MIPGILQQQFLKLRDATRDSGFHGAHGNAENPGDILIGAVLQIKEGDGAAKDLVDFREGIVERGGIEFGFAGG